MSRRSAPASTGSKPGDRVAYGVGPLGAYSERRVMPADRLVKLPDGVSDRSAATLMLKGLTVQYLFRQTNKLKAGDTILFHAAAGGVGLIACQWARALGVTMIGTVGSDEKAALAKAHGCTHTIVYARENFVERVKELTGGKGVPVVYDSVGKDTFPSSLDCLSPRGLFVSFGNSSGPVPSFDLMLLAQKGSLYATRPTLFTFATKREAHDRDGGRAVRAGAHRQDRERAAADVRAQGRRRRASHAAVARDHRRDRVVAVTRASDTRAVPRRRAPGRGIDQRARGVRQFRRGHAERPRRRRATSASAAAPCRQTP